MNVKRIVALLLACTMLLECVPMAFAEEVAKAAAVKKGNPVVTMTQHGPTIEDQTVDGNVVLTELQEMYIDGTLTLTGGGSLVVRSGRHRISRDAVIKGDIVIDGSAELELDGIVEGEIIIEQDESRWRDQWMHMYIGEHAVVRSLNAGLFRGDVQIQGSISRMKLGAKGAEEMLEEMGSIALSGNAFVGTIDGQGDILPHLHVMDNALITRMSMDGLGFANIHGGYVQQMNMKGSADAHLTEDSHVGELNVTEAGVWVSINGGKVDKVNVTNSSKKNKAIINEWYDENHAVVAAYKGSEIGDVEVKGLSSFVFGNVDTDIADSYADAPIASLNHEEFFKETVVNSIVTSGPVCIENNGYARYINLGKSAVYWGCGNVDVLKARDSEVYMNRSGEDNEELYHNKVRSLLNYAYYDSMNARYAEIRGGNVSVGVGCSVGTLIADRTNLGVSDFECIDNLVLNRASNVYVQERGTSPETSEQYPRKMRINRMFYNNVYNYGFGGKPVCDVGTLSVFESAVPAMWDVEKVLLAKGKKTLASAMFGPFGDVIEGERPALQIQEATGEEGQMLEASAMPEDTARYVKQVVTTQMKSSDKSLKGGTSAAKAKTIKKQSYVIRKDTTQDWWYTIETDALQSLDLTLDANEGMGMIVVYGPDGQHEVLVSECEKASASILSKNGGVWTLRLIGAPNDYELKVGTTNPIRVDWAVSSQMADTKGQGKKTALDLTTLDIDVENKTRGMKPEFIVTPDAIVMTNDQADRRDTLVLTVKDPENNFIPKSIEVKLSEGKASKKTTVYEYGSYRATCKDFTGVTMHLYDGEGKYIRTLSENRGVYTADGLLPGEYQVVMIRGDVGNWRFASLSDYADFGLEEKRDYRLDSFTLKEGYTDYYPSASVPAAAVIESPYAIESESRYAAARSACLVGGSVLMRVEYALENMDAIHEAYVDVQIGEGMTVQPEHVTLDGESVAATIENGFLRVPVTGQQAGQIAFYAFGGDVSELLSIARLTLETTEGTKRAYLGFSNVQMQTLSIFGSERSGGTINLYGYGVPGERVTILHNGEYSISAECDGEGKWFAVLNVEATGMYEDHEFAAVLYARTPEEMISPDTLTVRVHDSLPELESISLYYYEHGRLRKKEVTAQEFFRGKMHYSYEPGTEFTCTVRLSNTDRLEKLYYVQEYADGRTNYLPATYDSNTDSWSITGKFPYASMSGNWRFEYELAPLPEPERYTQEEIDALAAIELPEIHVEVLEQRIDESGNLVGKVRYTFEGYEPIEMGLDLGLSWDEPLDIEYLEAAAAKIIKDEAGNTIYLMLETDNWQDAYFYVVENQEHMAYSVRYHFAEHMMEAMLHGISGQALAEDFQNTLNDIGYKVMNFGSGVFEILADSFLTVADVWTYNVQIVRLVMLRNKIVEIEEKLAQGLTESESDERFKCLWNLMGVTGGLKQETGDLAYKFRDEAVIEGTLELVMKGFGDDLVKMMSKKNGLLRNLIKKVTRNGEKINDLSRAIAEGSKRLDRAVKNLVNRDKALKKAIQKQKDAIEKYLEKLDEKLRSAAKKDYFANQINDEIDSLRTYLNLIDKASLLKHGNDKHILKKVRNELQEQLAEDAAQAFLDKITDADMYKKIWANRQEILAEMQALLTDIDEAIQEAEELEKAEQELKAAEQEQAKLQQEAQKIVQETEEEEKNFLKKAIDESLKEMYDRYMREYNDLYDRYRDLLEDAESCPTNPPPTPTPAITPGPSASPDTTPTPTPSAPPPDNPGPNNIDPGIVGPDPGKKDPSGYVYEGVWTNRIEGVTATAYTQDEKGQTIMWDASLHGQQNPLITDAQGYYEWYVPEGMWQVKYEKDGYETSYSEWLPVPPPQTEVHQGIVSHAQPEIEYAIHYGNYVEIAFSKPVRTVTVNDSTVQIGMPFMAEPQDPERMGESDVVLASVFRMYPTGELGKQITVSVNGGVISYADAPARDMQIACERRKPLIGLDVPGSVELKAGEPGVLLLRALGEGDYQKYGLEISGAHDDLLLIGDAAFEANGQAAIALTPVSACTLTLTIKVPDTDIEAAVKVLVNP